MKFAVVPQIYKRTDRQTDGHAHRSAPNPYTGGEVIADIM